MLTVITWWFKSNYNRLLLQVDYVFSFNLESSTFGNINFVPHLTYCNEINVRFNMYLLSNRIIFENQNQYVFNMGY